jgi:serine/threonine-protein kinase HipA
MAEHQLAVWLGGRLVGSLIKERAGGFRFDVLPGAAALTASREGARTPWTRGFSRNWFDGLLPEGPQRIAAEGIHGVTGGDTFGLLAEIGWECAGAVAVLPEGRTPADGRYEPVTVDGVWERLDALPRVVDEVDLEVRLSLGGAQDKMLLHQTMAGWTLPLQGAPSTHIFKPEPTRYPGLAVAEAWSLRAAASATTTASARLEVAAGHRPTLIVTRYDRVITSEGVQRIHQEDMCQALGLPPASKYAKSTKIEEPLLSRLAEVLLRTSDPTTELQRLLQQVTINVALGNADAHAKNYSIVHNAGTVTLAPLYDVSPTMAFIPTQRRSSLPVGGKFPIDEITRAHILAEGRSWGIPDPVARRLITATLDSLAEGMRVADRDYPGLSTATHRLVDRQFARLMRSAW